MDSRFTFKRVSEQPVIYLITYPPAPWTWDEHNAYIQKLIEECANLPKFYLISHFPNNGIWQPRDSTREGRKVLQSMPTGLVCWHMVIDRNVFVQVAVEALMVLTSLFLRKKIRASATIDSAIEAIKKEK